MKVKVMKYITLEADLAYVTIVMDGSMFVGLYGIPPRGGYYYLASNFSECGYVDSEDEAKAELQRSWESPS